MFSLLKWQALGGKSYEGAFMSRISFAVSGTNYLPWKFLLQVPAGFVDV